MKNKINQVTKELIIIQFSLNFSLAPLLFELYFLNLIDLLEHLLKLLVSISISISIIKIEFDKYISEFHRFNQYILAMLFALITFLIIELIIEKNSHIFYILIILIILSGYVIHWILMTENSPSNNK